jgi:hypothetical protein
MLAFAEELQRGDAKMRRVCRSNAEAWHGSHGCMCLAKSRIGFPTEATEICPPIAHPHSTQRDERNAPQVLEKNQKWYTPLDTRDGTSVTAIRGHRNASQRAGFVILRSRPILWDCASRSLSTSNSCEIVTARELDAGDLGG